jgi:hypothetical protein
MEVKSFVTQYVEIIHDLLWQKTEYITNIDVYVEYYKRYEAYIKHFDITDSLLRNQGSREKVIANEIRTQTGSKSLEKAKGELAKCLELDGLKFDEVKATCKGANKSFRYPKGLTVSPLERYRQKRVGDLEKITSLLHTVEDLFPESWIKDMDLQLFKQKDAASARQIIQFLPCQTAGIQLVPLFYKYIIARQVVSFKYHPFGKKPYTVFFSPFKLREYNNRWFLLGMSRSKDGNQHYTLCAVDRIESPVHVIPDFPYAEPPFDIDEYYADVVGVSRNPEDEPQDIILQVNDMRALGYICSKPIHPSQRVEGCRVTMRVVVNYELETRLWEFADRVEVLAPDELRHQLHQRALRALTMTNKDQD